MAKIEASIVVPNSIRETFDFLDQPESHARFIPNMAEFKQTSPGPFGRVGTTIRGRLHIAGLQIPVGYEIVEYEWDRSLFMDGTLGPVRFRDGYILSPDSVGTKIQFILDLTLTGPARVFSPFAGWIGLIHARETLSNIKRELPAAQGMAIQHGH